MENLTENQQKVLQAITNGACTNDEIANQSGVKKSSITAVVNSLVKKEYITKAEDGSLTLKADEPAPQVVTEEDELTTPAVERTKGITVLIPYLRSEAAGEELRYALRAWEKHFAEDFNVVVIGDREEWFSPEVVHIPHEPHLVKEDCSCPNPSMIRNPQADVTHKVFTAIASGLVRENFILSNDDIYLLGPTTKADIEVLKAFGELSKSGKDGGLYNQNARKTAIALEKNGLPTVKYGTHTPMLLNAEKLTEIIEKYNALENGYLLTSLYFNELYPHARPIQVDGGPRDQILASVYRADVPETTLADVFAKRKFMNCNSKGWPSVKSMLESTFAEPSRFEK